MRILFLLAGIVIWELFTLGDEPYQDIFRVSDLVSFLATSQRLPYPDYSNDEIYDIMKQCWQSKKDLRPKFCKLKQHIDEIIKRLVE